MCTKRTNHSKPKSPAERFRAPHSATYADSSKKYNIIGSPLRTGELVAKLFQFVDGTVLNHSALRTFAAVWYSTGAGTMDPSARKTSHAR